MNGVDLELAVRGAGRAVKPVAVEIVRELTPVDLALLDLEKGIKPPTIKRLRDSHHAVAKYLADGNRVADVALMTGYTVNRISVLQNDPAFQELLAHYKAVQERIYADNHERMSNYFGDILTYEMELFEEDPTILTADDRLDRLKLLADRIGHGPSTKSTNVNINVDMAARVANGRARAARGPVVQANSAGVVEGQAEPPRQLAPPTAEPVVRGDDE